MTRNREIKAYVPKTNLLFRKYQIGYGPYEKHFAVRFRFEFRDRSLRGDDSDGITLR